MAECLGHHHRLAEVEPQPAIGLRVLDAKQAEVKAWEATYDLNTTSPPSAAMGFNFNAEPVKTELANLAAVTGELSGPLTSGLVDPATALPDYLERLEQAGIQTVIEEAQRQLEEWASKQ